MARQNGFFESENGQQVFAQMQPEQDPLRRHTGVGLRPDLAPEDEEGYAYAPGYGFIRLSRSELQRAKIRRAANVLGFGVMLSVFLNSVVSSTLLRVVAPVLPGVSVLENGDILASRPALYTIQLLVYIFSLLLPFLLVGALLGYTPKRDLPRRRAQLPYLCMAGLFLLGLNVVGSMLSGLFTSMAARSGVRFIQQYAGSSTSWRSLAVYAVLWSVVPAVVEELVYRGAVLQPLRAMGDRFAVVVSAAVFAMGCRSVVSVPGTFFVGLFLGYVAIKSGSIYTCMILHGLNSAFAIFMEGAQPLMGRGAYQVFLWSTCALVLLGGILAVILMARRSSSMFAITDLEDVNTLTTKLSTFVSSSGFLIAAGVVLFLLLGQLRLTG